MEIYNQLNNLVKNRPLAYSVYPSSNTSTSKPTNPAIIYTSVIAFGIIFYILQPTLFPKSNSKKDMFTKRPDKYTTGLINLRNDCFANSSVQAYLSLPGMTEYLNKFILSFQDFSKFVNEHGIDPSKLGSIKNSNPKFKKVESNFDVPLHTSLAKILKKLQSTQMTSRTISVWTFLHDLEKIFNAKISRSQHDAHELTQLINETLENEYLRITKKFKNLMNLLLLNELTDEYFLDSKANSPNYKFLASTLKLIEFPEFPLNGLILTQMKCLNCKGVSKPNFLQFLMLTLHTPEQTSTDLESLLNENESESIEDYQCLKCRIKYILGNETYLNQKQTQKLSEDESKIIEHLNIYFNDPKFCINDDLPSDIENYIRSYNKNNVDISKITSTVLRNNQILKPPKIFGLHLSRSSFNGVNVVRNGCRVSFRDHLHLSIGKEYMEDLKQLQAVAQDDEYYFINRPTDTKVLTTDVNDMEDEAVQREDIEETGVDGDQSEDTQDTQDEEDEIDDNETATDSDSVTSEISIPTLNPKVSSSKSSNSSTTIRTPDVLNNSPISNDQTDDLLTHFKRFKFNDNDIYKYKLKAMIRHQGSHTQGHYECYKRKPLYVKDKDGMIIKLSPEILDEVTEESKQDNNSLNTKFRRASAVSTTSSEGHSGTETVRSHSSSSDNDIFSALNEENIPEPPGAFRRKFSNMMGRRPSVFQADPEGVKIEEIIPSGLTTPAELVVQDVDPDYFGDFTDRVNAKLSDNKIKLKKIPSLLKNPYWRISDSVITEVTKASVLCETTSVYMLYYERVEK